jgi:adenylylsulfate kinase
MQYSHLCRIISAQGVTAVIATISLFHEVHIWNRKNLPGYIEVYLRVPMDELRRRDPKGIYRDFFDGKVANIVGLDLPADEPEAADLTLEFSADQTMAGMADQVLNVVRR